jgi:glutaminyl-tRNA synthetase
VSEKSRDRGEPTSNFIRSIIEDDLASGKHAGVVTRFPPEPNGYLHIGHSKSICLNFGLAKDYKGKCHLRFDDTNPLAEDVEYVQSIQSDLRWLGFDWGDNLFHSSDYYQQLYEFAVKMVREGTAYVCSLSESEIREYRGSVTEPGRPSPYRARSVDENMELLERMKAGEFADGAHVLRARIDMANPNMQMRDPLIYRIRKAHHYRTGYDWCIYPMYDFAHGLSDSIEGITHSLCTLEFENNRELYDWFLEAAGVAHRPQQIEFARLFLAYTVMSKRKLLRLVQENHVTGWDDPRMPTIAGLRRRGVTAAAIRAFCDRIGVAKGNSMVEYETLEYCIREDLNQLCPRVMAVVDPLKLVLENYPSDGEEWVEGALWPKGAPQSASRKLPFRREILIERSDFMENPTSSFHRLTPGSEVRLRFGYIVKCTGVIKDAQGQVVELRGTYDPDSKSGTEGSKRKVKGTIHWLSAKHALPVELRLYDQLFTTEVPDAADDFVEVLNPNSLHIRQALVEPGLSKAEAGTHWQFERQGYFFVDPVDSRVGAPVFNRVVELRDTRTKTAQTAKSPPKEPLQKQSASVAIPSDQPSLRGEEQARFDSLVGRGVATGEARVLALDTDALCFFEAAAKGHRNPAGLSKWVVNILLGEVKAIGWGDLKVDGPALGALVTLVDEGAISNHIARKVLDVMLSDGSSPQAVVEAQGLAQISDSAALQAIVDQVIAENPAEVERFLGGNQRLMGFFIGQVMQATKGQANAAMVRELLLKGLS